MQCKPPLCDIRKCTEMNIFPAYDTNRAFCECENGEVFYRPCPDDTFFGRSNSCTKPCSQDSCDIIKKPTVPSLIDNHSFCTCTDGSDPEFVECNPKSYIFNVYTGICEPDPVVSIWN